MQNIKICKTCNSEKDSNDFYANNKSCKKCTILRAKNNDKNIAKRLAKSAVLSISKNALKYVMQLSDERVCKLC